MSSSSDLFRRSIGDQSLCLTAIQSSRRVGFEPERSARLSLSLCQPRRVTRGVHLASVASDEEQNEWVVWSRAVAAMGADTGWRRGEVVGDPLNDTAALFSLALAQHGDNVPFAASR